MSRQSMTHRCLKRNVQKEQPRLSTDDPGLGYLLGFENDEEKRQPIKTYIRQLWLAFQSGPGSMPRCFLDDKSKEFSKEIDEWVSDYANDPNLLAEEVAKDSVIVDRSTTPFKVRSAFMEDTAHTLLVTRGWGEQLWGHRKYCVAPLANARAEKGEESPSWPRDQELITMAVRRWLAARLQERLNNPVEQKHIPRVPCPENPAERRASIAARITELERYDSSGEETDVVVEVEEVDEAEDAEEVVPEESEESAAQLPPRPQTPEEQRGPRHSTRLRKPSRRAAEGQRSLSSRDVADNPLGVESPADERRSTRKKAVRYLNPLPDLGAEQERSRSLDSIIDRSFPDATEPFISTQPAPKRKRNERHLPSKRSKTAPNSGYPRDSLPTPATSVCVAQPPSEEDRASPAPSIAPSLDLVDAESFGNDINSPSAPDAPDAAALQQVDVVSDQAVDDLRLHGDQSSAEKSPLHPQKPSRADYLDVVLLPTPEESSPLESTRALEAAPTVEHERAEEGRFDSTSYTPADLDINFDLYADPSADDSQLEVSQNHVSVEAVPETQHLPPDEPQQHGQSTGMSSNEMASPEREIHLPMPIQSSPRNDQPSAEVTPAPSRGHQILPLTPPSPDWDKLSLDVLNRLVNSLASVLDGSLTYDYMLNGAVPKVQELFAAVMQGVGEPEDTVAAWPMRVLNKYAAELTELRSQGRLSQLVGGDSPCFSPARDNDGTALISKLHELNRRFSAKVSTWSEGRHHLNLAACHDLSIVTQEKLSREPNYGPDTSTCGTLDAYDRLTQYLRGLYAAGVDGISLGNDSASVV